MRYRREIDGLRALAVIPVILFHAGFQSFRGGFVGVDVFFVISGYLITSIIIDEVRTDTFSLVRFYERRARRILPALFFVMFVCLLPAWLLMIPEDIKGFSQSLAAVSTFTSNILFWRESGYFDIAGHLKPLLHTWSLAVEEQYYVLFPIFLATTWRLGRRYAGWALALAGLVSLVLAQWGAYNSPSAAYFLLPTRGWELLIGAGIAFYYSGQIRTTPGPVVCEVASLTGLGLIAYSVFAFSENIPFPSAYTLVPTLGTALIIVFATSSTYVGRILGSQILVGLGLVSYSAYLWHQPLFAFARYWSLGPLGLFEMGVLGLCTIVLSYLTWRFVEQPFKRKAAISRTRIFWMAASMSALFLAIGLAGSYTSGFERLYAANLNEAQGRLLHTTEEAMTEEPTNDNGDCHFHSRGIDAGVERRFSSCFMKYGKALVVLGDSHAINLYQAIETNTQARFVFGISKEGCRPHTPAPDCPYDSFRQFVQEHSAQIQKVVYNQAGFYLIRDREGTPGSREFFARTEIPIYPPNPEFIDRVVEYLDGISRFAEVIWFGPWIEPHQNTRRLIKFAISCPQKSIDLNTNTIATFQKLDQYLADRVRRDAGFRYESLRTVIDFDAHSDIYECGSLYWRDGDHWSASGERRFGARITRTLELK